jgi:putative transport protein
MKNGIRIVFYLMIFMNLILPVIAIAGGGEAREAFRTDLGLIGGVLHFLGTQPFVLLFLVLALGTELGRVKFGFISLGSTAATLLVGITISLCAYLLYNISYQIPTLLTTIFLNLFMFAVGLKVGPQFFSGLRLDGIKFIIIALIVVGLNFAVVFGGGKALGLGPGFSTGLIAGSMTDTAVIGAATGAVESGTYRPPGDVTAADVVGHVAAGYAITYLFSLIGMILLIRNIPRLSGIDAKAAARAAEESYSGGQNRFPTVGTEAAYSPTLQLPVSVRAYKIEHDDIVGLSVREVSIRFDIPILRVMRGDRILDLSKNPIIERGDVATVIADKIRLVRLCRLQPALAEVADERALQVDIEVADLVVTRREFVGLTMEEAVQRFRRNLFPEGEEVGRIFHLLAAIRAGESIPIWPGTRIERGDIVRVIGPKDRIEQAGKLLGAAVRSTNVSDILTISLGLAFGYIIGYLSITLGGIPISLGTPAGVMLAGIAISTARSYFPLFGGPVSEGARNLLQDLGLDLFIAVVALNTAASVASAFTGGGVLSLLSIGVAGALIPPLVAWVVGLKFLKLNPAVLMGALSGARFSTPAMRAAQEECGSAVPAVGYPVPYAIAAVLVLVAGYLALFL